MKAPLETMDEACGSVGGRRLRHRLHSSIVSAASSLILVQQARNVTVTRVAVQKCINTGLDASSPSPALSHHHQHTPPSYPYC